MGDLSASLSRKEFACKCGCGFDTVDHGLVTGLQAIVDSYGGSPQTSIVITSGCRCEAHNTSVGGSPKSKHVTGRAADFKLYDRDTKEQHSSKEVYDRIDSLYENKCGSGLYSNRNHFDSRDGCARWGT